MTAGIKTITYPVKDLAGAKTLFNILLEAEPVMDEPYYAGYRVAGQDIGPEPHGHGKGMTGPLGHWHVDDIEASVKKLLEAGAETVQAIQDVGGGKLIASLKGADGNAIGLIQPACRKRGPGPLFRRSSGPGRPGAHASRIRTSIRPR
ncbi:VOC family protein [Streptomyces atratus]|uniref:VOC family protein n=1 Tax=Streptomyces atratus TaxID=1893 RepID=UPI003F53F729